MQSAASVRRQAAEESAREEGVALRRPRRPDPFSRARLCLAPSEPLACKLGGDRDVDKVGDRGEADADEGRHRPDEGRRLAGMQSSEQCGVPRLVGRRAVTVASPLRRRATPAGRRAAASRAAAAARAPLWRVGERRRTCRRAFRGRLPPS